jgi:OLD-like protein
MFGAARSLVYIKKEKDISSKVFADINGIKNYIFNPNILFSNYNILVEGPGDVACFYAISDSLNSIFEKYNITVVDANDDGHIDPLWRFIKFLTLLWLMSSTMVVIHNQIILLS